MDCLLYETKPSDDEALVLELWVMCRTLSLQFFPGTLGPAGVTPIRFPSIDQTEFSNHLRYWKSFHFVQKLINTKLMLVWVVGCLGFMAYQPL